MSERKYTVLVSRTTLASREYEVFAETPEEAELTAEELAREGDWGEYYCETEYEAETVG